MGGFYTHLGRSIETESLFDNEVHIGEISHMKMREIVRQIFHFLQELCLYGIVARDSIYEISQRDCRCVSASRDVRL